MSALAPHAGRRAIGGGWRKVAGTLALLAALFSDGGAQPAQPAASPIATPQAIPPTQAFADDRAALDPYLAALPAQATALVAVRLGGDSGAQWLLQGTGSRDGAPVTRDSRFELGSVTKALTGSLLARLASQGLVQLDDPVERWLPQLAGTAAGRLSLRSLATHQSGLPRLPVSVRFMTSMLRGPRDPYRHYGQADLIAWLQHWGGEPEPTFAYSNLGFALLGLALEHAAGQPLARLMEEQILRPAQAEGAGLDEALAAGQIAGHDEHGRPTPAWTIGAFAGAGALRANAQQMAALLDAARTRRPPFDAGAEREQARRHAHGAVGLGWMRTERHDDRIVWHNGGTGGFRSFFGYSEISGRGVVLMVNGQVDVDSLGLHLINPAFAAEPPGAPRRSGVLGWIGTLIAAAALGSLAWRAWRPPSRVEQPLEFAVAAAMLAYAWHVSGDWAGPWPWALAGLALALGAAMLWRGRAAPRWPAQRRRTLWALASAGLGLAFLAWLW